MTTKDRKKLCWNCEGRVSIGQENCPYCGVYISPSTVSEDQGHHSDPLSPPYRLDPEDQHNSTPTSPYQSHDSQESSHSSNSQVENKTATGMKKVLTPLSFLLTGSVFFLFGLALALFSQGSTFTLQWDATWWYLYLFSGLVLLFFGWKTLQHVDEENS